MEEYRQKVIELIKKNNTITAEELAQRLGIGGRTIKRYIKLMGNIQYVGSGFSGHWEKVDK